MNSGQVYHSFCVGYLPVIKPSQRYFWDREIPLSTSATSFSQTSLGNTLTCCGLSSFTHVQTRKLSPLCPLATTVPIPEGHQQIICFNSSSNLSWGIISRIAYLSLKPHPYVLGRNWLALPPISLMEVRRYIQRRQNPIDFVWVNCVNQGNQLRTDNKKHHCDRY